MRDEQSRTANVVALLLRTWIRNAYVNDGTAVSGHEIRNVDTLEAYLTNAGLAIERYTAAPERFRLVAASASTSRACACPASSGLRCVATSSRDGPSIARRTCLERLATTARSDRTRRHPSVRKVYSAVIVT